ncbi:MAG TPA: uracil-DNA glycosylase [Gemmatimonadaceae bacterium]|nr:uracil-DNA glycosylase [Gemmatimonadaceae bacterium]
MSDPREQLRRYLEQRRELGERELVLDSVSVDEALRIVGGAGPVAPKKTEEPRDVRQQGPIAASDWRTALRAAGAEPGKESEMPRAAKGIPASTPEIGGQLAPPGIVVGTSSRELFGSGGPSLDSLESLEKAIATCTRCPLYATAKNPVPGEGNPDADFMLVGEAPGATEDETGRPFVGQAGQLLEKILAAIKFSREDVFIVNVLKHRPPGNRNPLPQEVSACSPYLVRQIELIRPKVLVALGTFAAQTLLDTKLSIGKLRGQIHRYYGVPLIVTYHPAALLRNPAWKRPTWEDVQLARRILDRALSGA